MKNLIKNKVFISMFLLAYFLFFVITIYVLDLKTSGFGVGSMDYGFPFTYYSSHCFGGNYLWVGLIGNIIVATAISFIVGLISTHFWLKFSSPQFRAKWHI
jgi:hypothetical protein